MATDPWGIDDGYFDVGGTSQPTPPETREALRTAMGAGRDGGDDHGGDKPDDGPPAPKQPLWVVRAGAADPLWGPCEVRLEDGSAHRAEGTLPPDLPIG